MSLRKRTAIKNLAAFLFAAGLLAAQEGQPSIHPNVGYVPTSQNAVAAMLKLADVKETDIVYDLGCGDGRIVIAAAKERGARGVGIDIDPQRIREARENAKSAGVDQLVRFEVNNLFDADIHEASVVALFLTSSMNLRLRPKLLRDLKAGSRIVSNSFDMGDWKPDRKITVKTEGKDRYFSRILYLWAVPPRP